ARFVNGAGGGNPKNAGGGGGGHWTGGGMGGGGTACSPGAGGLGGSGLWNYIYFDRFFMGGGGGGGQQNNSVGGAGGAGGGIVIVKADVLRTVGPCPDLFISANGANGGSSIAPIPDGAGGGGAGGSVFLLVNTFNIDATCALTCQANGGNGGQVICSGDPSPAPGNWLDWGGGGGGGAQGMVMCMGFGSSAVQAATGPGNGGMHDGFGGRAMDAPGPANGGVQGFGSPVLLPLELLYFKGEARSDAINLLWATASELNVAAFEVERSADLNEWSLVGSVAAGGNGQQLREYGLTDASPHSGVNYYRLVQMDMDGTRIVHGTIAINIRLHDVRLAPQPANDAFHLTGDNIDGAFCTIMTAEGREVEQIALFGAGSSSVDVAHLPAGTYIVRLEKDGVSLLRSPLIIAR
ncbi:MAG TPA: hypothetical protein PK760_08125, partial [Flavobacteriales bacterium]|nr:hypothetical protein [Flavobacteriales bacterium]